MRKRVQSLLLAAVLAFSLIVPASAYADVTGGEWYAEAAEARAQVADMVYRYVKLKEMFASVDAVSGATQKAYND